MPNKNTYYTGLQSFSFYSYLIIIAASIINMAIGARAAFGVFFEPMASEFAWSSAAISGTFSISMIIEGIVSAVSGWLSDKLGTRVVLTFAGLITGAGFILMSQIHTMWQMYLVYGIALGIGMGGLMVPSISMLAKSFVAQRSMVTGIVLATGGIGQLIAPLLAHQLISSYDWRMSFIIFGLILFVLIIIPGQFLKPRFARNEGTSPNRPVPRQNLIRKDGTSHSFSEALRTSTFWLMIIIFGSFAYCFLSLMVHLVPYSIHIGISAGTAAIILACFGGVVIIGRLVLGAMGDRIGNKKTTVAGFILLSISMLLLLFTGEVWTLFLFAVIGGIGMGGINTSQSPLSAEYFGVKAHGSIFGVMAGITVILGAIGPFVTGFLFDSTGSYQIPFIVCAVISFTGVILCTLLKPARTLSRKA
ncbi:MAG: MFS transporter [Dehalococcoidales bacterium]|nr:MFS transporter [Dehalococcoidales bacterium]